ncbi:anhydro-N-acetylmuramic acid kinase [bacterium]|nr:anhydro-N-acetylmuramic acid kinase [bacterium]
MSGTSVDGVDAALCEVSGSYTDTRVKLLSFRTLRFAKEVRERIHAAFSGNVQHLCETNFVLGEVFAEAVIAVATEANVPLAELDLVASHGQTVYHMDRSQGGVPSTLQLGEASVIAERTGALVVSDFRTRDVAAGGAGAPLVPYVDFCLFSGEVDRELLARLLAHPYLELPPPKTTGREVFGVEFSRSLMDEYDAYKLIDLLATVARFTAESIVRAYRRFVMPQHKLTEAIVSGGGAHNATLMNALREMLREDGVRVRSFDEVEGVGFSGKAKEAVAFAVLANETIQGLPSNLPAATGARRAVVLGKISL